MRSKSTLIFALALGLAFGGSRAIPAQETKPPAVKPVSPEQQESVKIQAQIRELQKRILELRVKGLAGRHLKDIEQKKVDDELIAKLCQGEVAYSKIAYPSAVDGLSIPAYLFLPLKPRGPKGHPALVWVHGGVHSSFGSDAIPFIRQAVGRGYIVIAPEIGRAHV